MGEFDSVARQYADEIRVAAYRDRIAEPRGEFTDACNIADSSLTAALRQVANSLQDVTRNQAAEPMLNHDQEEIVRMTAQRLNVDPQMLQAALAAVVKGHAKDVIPCFNHLLQHAE